MRIENEVLLDFKDVLIKPKRSTIKSRSEVDLHRTYKFVNSGNSYTGIPIIAANMDTVGTFDMLNELGKHDLSVALHKHYTLEELIAYFRDTLPVISNDVHPFYSMGITWHDQEKWYNLKAEADQYQFDIPDFVCIDVANGYSEPFLDFVKEFRSQNPDITIMAGNVVTGEMTEALILAGADIVKVGIGPGSVCTTRKQTGVGYPQLSAIIETADAAHGLGGHVCSDGGCTVPGDVAKAFGAGADFVMLGAMLSGHDESGGELIEVDGKKFKEFYGMSSKTAQEKNGDGLKEYRASEGRTAHIPYKGSVSNTVQDILGGLRSTLTYVGASKLKELSKRTTFVRVSQQLNNIYSDFTVGD